MNDEHGAEPTNARYGFAGRDLRRWLNEMDRIEQLTIRPDPATMKRLLSAWSWRLDKPDYIPLFLSVFGDWFLRDERGLVYMLDLVAGHLRQIAGSETEFMANLEDEEYQREWLMSQLASALSGAGVSRTETQCFAFRTPPILGGTLSPDNVLPWDLAAYQSATSKVHQQVAGLEPGTEVVTKPG